MADIASTVAVYGGAIGTAITGIATIFLWRVTRTLAKATSQMAAASAQPHVVATIEPNRWSMIHFDLQIENTGNATAYDISISFDPTPQQDNRRKNKGLPFQQISVLKPTRRLSTYLAEFKSLQGQSFEVVVSWRRRPGGDVREKHAYTLSMRDMDGVTRLGSGDPLIQIAEEVKHLREDWKRVASGFTKVKADVYGKEDRDAERARYDELRRGQQESAGAEPGPDDGGRSNS